MESIEILPEIQRELFPLRPDELGALEESILREGVRDPLVVWKKENKLILVDGHNRYVIAQKHNLEFKVVEKEFKDINEVIDWIDNNQLGRRNLTDEQRALIIGRIYDRQKKQGKRTDLLLGVNVAPSSGSHATAKAIAKETAMGEKSVRKAAEFARTLQQMQETRPDAAQRILEGEIKDALTMLPKVAKESPDLLSKVVEKIAEGKTDRIREVVSALKIEERRNEVKEHLKSSSLPEDKYNVILCDPPWKYEFAETENRSVENHYPTMEAEEIKAIKVPSADDSILFLWSTTPKLEIALQVMNAWGFKYRTCAVWDKEVIGMGYWFRIQHELLLIGIKGKFLTPDPQNRVSSVIREKRTEHSKKPLIVYEIIEKMFPNYKYLEMFATQQYNEKWTVWGNQL